MRLIFMGSPDFACPSLRALLESPHEIICVYTQPPRPKGRGQQLQATPIQHLAEQHNLAIRHPARLTGDALAEICATPCDAIVVVAYGLLLPQAVLDHAPCLNIHPSALPRWRGPAPLQHSLLQGDTHSAVCIMQLDAGMDTGPILKQQGLTVDPNTILGELHDQTAQIGADLLLQVLADMPAWAPTPQAQGGVTFAPKILKSHRPINWAEPAPTVHNHIRALSPFPAATMEFRPKFAPEFELETWKLHRSHIATGAGQPGEILGLSPSGITIACGTGAVQLLELQRPGKPKQSAGQIVQAGLLTVGDFVG